jgi:hypothetical protein
MTIILCFLFLPSFAQDRGFIKMFPGNDSVTYLTNSRLVKGLAFYHDLAQDTSNAIFYIENYKYSDVKVFPAKIKVMNAKLCFDDYKSNPGDFIFTMDSKSEIIFYYHLRESELMDAKFN